jgi:hypothetical protein
LSRIKFSRAIPLINDFLVKSDFRKFYKSHLDYYESIINQQKLLDIDRMWHWLENEYPTRMDSYQVIISPLTGGWHNTISLIGTQYQECLMYISAASENDGGKTDTLTLSAYERVLFTEIDHNYVNPQTDLLKNELSKVDWKKWYDNRNSGYSSAYATFNEYMTWALFLAYEKERYPNQYMAISQRETNRLEKNRGFAHFREFTDELLKQKTNDPTLPYSSLQVKMIHWMALNQ